MLLAHLDIMANHLPFLQIREVVYGLPMVPMEIQLEERRPDKEISLQEERGLAFCWVLIMIPLPED